MSARQDGPILHGCSLVIRKDLIKIEPSQVPEELERVVSRSVYEIQWNNRRAVQTVEPWISVYWLERDPGEPLGKRVWVCTDRYSPLANLESSVGAPGAQDH